MFSGWVGLIDEHVGGACVDIPYHIIHAADVSLSVYVSICSIPPYAYLG